MFPGVFFQDKIGQNNLFHSGEKMIHQSINPLVKTLLFTTLVQPRYQNWSCVYTPVMRITPRKQQLLPWRAMSDVFLKELPGKMQHLILSMRIWRKKNPNIIIHVVWPKPLCSRDLQDLLQLHTVLKTAIKSHLYDEHSKSSPNFLLTLWTKD